MPPEFSRILQTKGITKTNPFSYVATPQECLNIAQRLRIADLSFFSITGKISLTSAGFKLTATLSAQFSLEKNTPQKIDIPLEFLLAPSSTSQKQTDLHAVEALELSSDGSVEIGEVFVQYFSLNLAY